MSPKKMTEPVDLSPFVATLRAAFDDIVKSTLGAGLSGDEQIVTYELAMGKADLYAAESLCRYAQQYRAADGRMLESALGNIGCAQAAFELKARLEKVCVTTGLDASSLHQIFTLPALTNVLHSAYIETLGRLDHRSI